MELTALSNIFDISYGNSFELNGLDICEDVTIGVNFVSRTSKNNGVSAIVESLPNIKPFRSGLITVSLGGSVLESFVQPKPFYTGYHVMVLTPKKSMSDEEKLFYCSCIESNKYRYNYGRQANRTLRGLKVPVNAPIWLTNIKSVLDEKIKSSFNKPDLIDLEVGNWNWFKCDELFTIERGKGPRLNELTKNGSFPFVTSTDQNNGWNGASNYTMHSGNTISVARNGSVGEAFYQPMPFASTEDVHIFKPKFAMNVYIALFFVTILKMEKYRYNYGRKWGMKRMNDTSIKLPATITGEPNYKFMENYIKTLPYSSSLTTDEVKAKPIMSVTQKKGNVGLSDMELAAKYDNGGSVDFDKALKKMSKSPSPTTLAKQKNTK